LVLVPDALVNQWFVELWRRFNLLFSVFDVERCESIEANNPEANPFLDSQLVIASVSFVCSDPVRGEQLRAAGWDLMIVDEAHHLRWTPKEASSEYLLVESLAREVTGVLLLTATPQQLGPEGHFARLRLLDPEKYADLEAFNASAGRYQEVARFIDSVLNSDPLEAAWVEEFSSRSKRVAGHLQEITKGNEQARGLLVSELLDAFGIGRAMYRNTRAALKGFPQRIAILKELAVGDDLDETAVKLRWLVELLASLGDAKVLLICASRSLAEQLVEKLLQLVHIKVALFHEGLTLLQRDRNAAYFSEADGARLLVCSEIGSEGRNFQFAHHLVLFDLPGDPELLEQRIGRLDRIGQSQAVRIYVPYFKATMGEVLARWYHEGLNAFESCVHGGGEIWISQRKDLERLEKKFSAAGMRKLLAAAVQLRQKVGKRLEEGNDRLLELASCRADLAEEILAKVRECDEDREFEEFALRLLDCCGVAIENLDEAGRGYLFSQGPMMRETLGALPPEGFSATFSRRRAMQREDLRFVTIDHPLIGEGMDSLLGGEKGNVSFVIWPASGTESILLEVVVVVECVADGALHMDRFMPPTPVRVLVDPACEEVIGADVFERAVFEEGDVFRLLDRGAVKKKLLPAMLEKAKVIATEKMALLVSEAQTLMDVQLHAEILRLEELTELHPDGRADEVEHLRQRAQKMRSALAGARFRLDSLRLIWRMA
jgi:ATP-dependent helicase HepA